METTKYFSYIKTLSASSVEVIDFRNDPNTQYYFPFSNCAIMNTGATDLKVYPNQGTNFIIVPAGVLLPLEDQNLESIKIENLSGTTTANYYLTLDNKETTLSLLKKVLGRV